MKTYQVSYKKRDKSNRSAYILYGYDIEKQDLK